MTEHARPTPPLKDLPGRLLFWRDVLRRQRLRISPSTFDIVDLSTKASERTEEEQEYRSALVRVLSERDAAKQQLNDMRAQLRQAESALSGMLHHDAERAHHARMILQDIRTELEK